MSPLLLFFKSYIPEHQRRLKNGQVVTVAAYYDKRIKKAAIHAPDHTHDVSHLSDTDKVKFSNMHKEQHVAHFYESHALKRKLSTEEQLRDTLKKNLERYEASGDKKSAAITRKKIAALSLRIGTHKNMHDHANKIVEGIGKLKHQLVEGSSELKDDADKQHAHYVGKLGARFSDRPNSSNEPVTVRPVGETKGFKIPPKPDDSRKTLTISDRKKLSLKLASAYKKYTSSSMDDADYQKYLKTVKTLGASEETRKKIEKAVDKPGFHQMDAYQFEGWGQQQVSNDDSHKDGDTNADGLVFHDGRWHRDDENDSTKDFITSKSPKELVEDGFESYSPKSFLNDSDYTKDDVNDFVSRLQSDRKGLEFAVTINSSGYSIWWNPNAKKDTALQSAIDHLETDSKQKDLPVKERAEDKKLVGELKSAQSTTDDLNPNSPNYRYKDTGNISGSKKEKAAERIKNAAKFGERLNATDIDWDAIEQNPREAQTLITKANLFGAIDWNALKEKGMESGTGFLIDKIYRSINKEAENEGAKRKYYAIGLQTIRDRMEECKTVDDVFKALSDIYNESTGDTITADNTDEYNAAQAEYNRLKPAHSEAKRAEVDALNKANSISRELYAAQRKQADRKSRGWKPDADLDASIVSLDKQNTSAFETLELAKKSATKAWDNLFPHYDKMRELTKQSRAKNLLENSTTAAWNALGKNFTTLIKPSTRSTYYPNLKSGSDSFLSHAIDAKKGRIKDWTWAEKDPRAATGEKAPREKPFQLLVADKITRKGGKEINVDSTQALKDMIGLRDVQSGVWVLKDKTSAEFHVQKCAEAFSDLSDILGVPLDKIALNGRLAMAFGARGHGTALAHYEPVQRVINLTKMKGGGSLAHEWLHSLDNMVAEMEGGKLGTINHYISEDPGLLPDGKVKNAIINLRQAMIDGETPVKEPITYTAKDIKTGKYNFDNAYHGLAKDIKNAGSLDKAIDAINSTYTGRTTPKLLKSAATWRKITAAYYDNNPEGGTVHVATGKTHSMFADGALNLDKGNQGKYWSKPLEMMARAFEGYTNDKLKAEGRENTYLTSHAKNDDYASMGAYKPYPEGAERRLINAAFDEFFDALRESGTLHKAFGVKQPLILFFKKAV